MTKETEIRKAVLEAEFEKVAGKEGVQLYFATEKVMTVVFEGQNVEAEENLVAYINKSGNAEVKGHCFDADTNETYIWVKFAN